MLKINYKVLTPGMPRGVRKWADDTAKETRKALSLAVSRVAYKLYRNAAQGLKTGRLGLKPKSRYRNKGVVVLKGQQVYMKLDKRYRPPRGARAFLPLTSLFKGILYDTNWRRFVSGTQKDAKWEVDFLGDATRPAQIWAAKIAEKSIAGYRWAYPPHAREYLHAMGIHLRKTTTSAKVPRRDIMGAVRRKHPDHIILQDIRTLFDRKMRGERI